MVVDYAANGNVCRIQLPAIAPESSRPGVESVRAMDDFILGLAPLALRGKELRRWASTMGQVSLLTVEYENISISRMSQGATPGGVTVTFKAEQCQDQPIP
jgi:hypothetical protein